MNNHWFTNFPLTQDGPVTFRYRIQPTGLMMQPGQTVLAWSRPTLLEVAANANAVFFQTVDFRGRFHQQLISPSLIHGKNPGR